jgi:branched-chain amino acid transport system ATP-binding protein
MTTTSAAGQTPLAVDIVDLHVAYGALKVLEGVDLDVAVGERRCMIGPNGAGKTTLFNTLAGVVPPSAGTIRLLGRDVSRLVARQRAQLGIARTFQRTKLFPELSVMDNLVLSMVGLQRARFNPFRSAGKYEQLRHKAIGYLDRFDLVPVANREIREMGYGEQRQIEILMALVQDPKLLLLDEPTAGLAAADGHIVTEMLDECPPDMTIVMIEHDMDVVFDFASRLSVLNAGTIVADGTVDEVRANPMVQDIYLGVQ